MKQYQRLSLEKRKEWTKGEVQKYADCLAKAIIIKIERDGQETVVAERREVVDGVFVDCCMECGEKISNTSLIL